MSSRQVLAVLALAAIIVGAGLIIRGGDDRVSATGGVISIGAGYKHTCVVLADGGVQCWGSNEYGQLGNGTTNDSTTPVDVCASGSGTGCSGGSRLTGIVDVAGGFGHTCALTNNGGVKCWGTNGSGRLGDGTTNGRTTAGDVCASGSGPICSGGEPLSGVEQMDVGGGFACALMSDTGIKCWGSDEVGQLGIGTIDPVAGSSSTAGGFGGFESLPVDVCVPGFIIIPFSSPATELAGIPLQVPCPGSQALPVWLPALSSLVASQSREESSVGVAAASASSETAQEFATQVP